MSNTADISDNQLRWIFYYGTRPLWKYLASVLNIDISEVCMYVTKEDVFLDSESVKLIPRVVTLPHSNELADEKHNNDVCFLINSINTVFESLKNLVQKDEEYILSKYKFKMDDDHNLFLIDAITDASVCDLAIAITIE